MFRFSPIAVCITAALAAGLPAQNMVRNGDFAKVTGGNPDNWTLQKFDFAPAVVPFDTAGLGADNAVSATHGKQSTSSTGIGELVQDGMLIIQGETYELRADVAVGGGLNTDPGKFEFFVDGVSVGAVDFTQSRGTKPAGTTFRQRFCVRFQATTVNANAKLTIAVSRALLALPGRTPVAYVDNVFLGNTRGPVMCFPGERQAGTQVALEVHGRPSTPFVFYAAAGLLPSPVTIPGWHGRLELAPPFVYLFGGSTDASGTFSVKLATPPGAGRIFVQGAVPGTVGVIDLGYAQLVNVY